LAGLLIGCGKKVKFCRIFRDRFAEKLANFTGNFGENFVEKHSVKQANFVGIFWSNFARSQSNFAVFCVFL